MTKVGLAISSAPPQGLTGRQQIASHIKWGDVVNNRREGIAVVATNGCDSVLTILMVGAFTIRRQWIGDPSKARNNRYIAVSHFDRDLRKVREAVLDLSDSKKFEQGIAALLFLLGYSPAQQIETESPDLIVATPGGKLLVVECTLKVSDFAAKMGKLVDRRESQAKALELAGHSVKVLAVLICRLPRDQIATHSDQLRAHKIFLQTRGDLEDAFYRVTYPRDLDKAVDEICGALQSNQAELFESGVRSSSAARTAAL